MKHLLFVGTLNQPTSYFEGANGDGLSVYDFDEETFEAKQLANAPHVLNPTFLTPTADGQFVYANSEIDGWKEGLVTAFSFDRATNHLRYLNMQPSLGGTTAHNAISHDGQRLFVVNYAMGTGGPDRALVVFDRHADGSISLAVASTQQSGTGPNTVRQDRSHPHSVTEIRKDLLLVADLGSDRLTLYRAGMKDLEKVGEARTRPGAGPRHVAVDPSGRFVFVINELDSTIASYGFNDIHLTLEPIGVYATIPADAMGTNYSADLQISADGRFLYGTNRGHDSIVAFAVNPSSGELAPIGNVSCGGRTPRNIALSPGGRLLLCANQDSDVVTIFARHASTGSLRNTGHVIPVGTPMCLRFAAGASL